MCWWAIIRKYKGSPSEAHVVKVEVHPENKNYIKKIPKKKEENK